MIYHVCSTWSLIFLMRPSLASVIKDSVKCTEGSVAVDNDDCASYFQCLDDEAVHMNCPNGSYFEVNNEVCIVDEFNVCPTSRKKCFEGYVSRDLEDCAAYLKCLNGNLVKEKCPEGTYFNAISKSCSFDRAAFCTSKREICAEGELQVNSEDCAGYLQCVNGVLVKEKCPSGSYFEDVFKLCQVDENGVCSSASQCNEGEVQADPNNCAGYLNCQNGELAAKICPSGTYFEPTYKVCVVDLNGVCVDPPAKCSEGQLTLDPNNCAGYLKCIDGELVKEPCPSGSYYDPKLESCLVDSEGVCVTKNKNVDDEYKKDKAQNELTGSNVSYSQSTDSEADYPSNVYTESTVTDSQTTDSAQQKIIFTKNYNDKYYKEKIQNSVIRSSVTFIQSSNSDEDISSSVNTESTVADTQTTDSAHEKVTEIQSLLSTVSYPQSTDSDEVYSSDLYTESTVADLQPTDSALEIPKSNEKFEEEYFKDEVLDLNTESAVPDIQTTDSAVELTSYDPVAQCIEGELRLNADNCAGYLKCVDGVLRQETCPAGFFYNYTLKNCSVDIRAVCATNIKFCIEGVREENPQDCAGYRQCIRGVVKNLQCPPGRYYNAAERDCLVDVHRVCLKSEDEILIPYNESVVGDFVEQQCPEGQLKMDPNNCAGYLECVNGRLSVEQCPSGSYFDFILKVCLVDRRGICVTNIEVCDEGAREENPQDCAGYRLCIGGEVSNLKCASGEYFSVLQRECLVDEDEMCV
ncbi:uncharacterized protein LOC108086536 [Drosophila ficusphila]|uniref:uncharacterized protein LOC108086536 n=1 Tax=Drosophila ficusphila TaxID=30025 RepID=UPI0007E67853|nr:uncharacterized protein LOC108086536 [Drosophila ficusphila]